MWMQATDEQKPNLNLGSFSSYKEKYNSMKERLKALLIENELFQDEVRRLQHELLDIYRDKETILEKVIQCEDIGSSSSDSESQLSDTKTPARHDNKFGYNNVVVKPDNGTNDICAIATSSSSNELGCFSKTAGVIATTVQPKREVPDLKLQPDQRQEQQNHHNNVTQQHQQPQPQPKQPTPPQQANTLNTDGLVANGPKSKGGGAATKTTKPKPKQPSRSRSRAPAKLNQDGQTKAPAPKRAATPKTQKQPKQQPKPQQQQQITQPQQQPPIYSHNQQNLLPNDHQNMSQVVQMNCEHHLSHIQNVPQQSQQQQPLQQQPSIPQEFHTYTQVLPEPQISMHPQVEQINYQPTVSPGNMQAHVTTVAVQQTHEQQVQPQPHQPNQSIPAQSYQCHPIQYQQQEQQKQQFQAHHQRVQAMHQQQQQSIPPFRIQEQQQHHVQQQQPQQQQQQQQLVQQNNLSTNEPHLSAEELEQHLEIRRMEQAALLLPDWEFSVPSEIFSSDAGN